MQTPANIQAEYRRWKKRTWCFRAEDIVARPPLRWKTAMGHLCKYGEHLMCSRSGWLDDGFGWGQSFRGALRACDDSRDRNKQVSYGRAAVRMINRNGECASCGGGF